ncbi:hypothetical protein LJR231_003268 [Phyllobacterium sp. LjRoot231]|uniref:hypothetical protein n=1 Tax=Phyllobacterium sp. LjRoot231 TaxID=3342289 RepID=UPI003ECC5B99
MAKPAAVFDNDVGLETTIYVHEIGKHDTTLRIDIYTWNPRNARKALRGLRGAIDGLLDEWNTAKYVKSPPATVDGTKRRPVHYAGEWPMHTL